MLHCLEGRKPLEAAKFQQESKAKPEKGFPSPILPHFEYCLQKQHSIRSISLHWDILKLGICRMGEGNGTPLQYSCLENPMDGLQSMGLRRVGHNWETSLSLFIFMHWRRKWQPTPVFLPGESRDGRAWWAAVYGVTQNWTRLKRLSSSSVGESEGRGEWWHF